jgi:hypothetical protein
MRGRSLHVPTLLVLAVIAAATSATLALGVSPGAVAANPHYPCNTDPNSPTGPILSCHFVDSFVDPDFCGTGQTVDLAFDGRFTVPVAPKPGYRYNNSESNAVLTNPATGATVLEHSAYRFTGTLLSGDPNGAHTEQWVFKGGPEIIRVPHGGVIARDAGNLVVEATFDADGDVISVEILSDRGGHLLFTNGDCSVLVPALGLA